LLKCFGVGGFLFALRMHLVHAFMRLPEGKVSHCKLGYFLIFFEGLYLLRSINRCRAIIDVLPQIGQVRDIV